MFEIAGKRGWSKTHSKIKKIFGASFCRRVDVDQCDWRRDVTNEETPTCAECARSLRGMKLYNITFSRTLTEEESRKMFLAFISIRSLRKILRESREGRGDHQNIPLIDIEQEWNQRELERRS